jgi:hypothetical protein
MAALNFNKHLNHWHYNCKNGSKTCLICYNTSCNKAYNSKVCPILKRIGYKLVKSSLETEAASHVGNNSTPATKTPAAAPLPTSLESVGSGSAPKAFTVAMYPDSYNLGDDFIYEGKN